MSSTFNGDVILILPPIDMEVLDVYRKAMDGMDNSYDIHVWSRSNTTNIQNEFGLAFKMSSCVGHLQRPDNSCKDL